MDKTRLHKNLNRLGFPLLATEMDFDVNQTLTEVVLSKDSRLWEGFPVLLANAAQTPSFDYQSVLRTLPDKETRQDLHFLLLLSLAMYKLYHLTFPWANQLKKKLSKQDVDLVKNWRNSLAHDNAIVLRNKRFDANRLQVLFDNYFEKNSERTRQLKEKHEELSLEYALAQLFSAKQKELFKKKLEGLPLTKTEREYYSRTVKKKVAALANPELHRLAQKLMEY